MAAATDVFVDHARRCAEQGWTLLRLNGKVPYGREWQKTRPAPADYVAGMWSRWGDKFNIGVLLGASGVTVVEADTEAAQARLLELLGSLPVTPIAETGRGLLHLYFQDGGHGNKARGGLELRAGAQQCVLPPSVHPDTGRPYRWLEGHEPWTLPLLPLPDALAAFFGVDQHAKAAPSVVEEIGQGGRHRALLSLAGTMRRRGLGLDEILGALRETNRLRCKPPLLDDELAELVRDVVRRYQPAPPDPARAELEREAERLLNAWAAGDETPASVSGRDRATRPLIVKLSEFLAGDDDAAWLVDHLAARAALVIVAGLPKVGKSTFVYGMLGVLTGGGDQFVGLPTTSTAVLLLTEESPATVEEKADRFGLDDERVYVLSKRRIRAGRKWAKVVEAAAVFCRDHPEIGLLVVDTLDKFADLDAKRSEGDTGVIRETIDPLYEVLDLGVCVLLITHQRKEEGSFGLRVRGGTALVGSADIVVEVERAAESAGLAKSARLVKLVSRFAGGPDEFAVTLGDQGWRSLGDIARARRRTRREQVLEWLTGELSTLDEILERAAGTVTAKTLRRRLDDLVKDGIAERAGSGRRGDPGRWSVSQTWADFSGQPENMSLIDSQNPSIQAVYSGHPQGGV